MMIRIKKPTFLIDSRRAKANIARMAAKSAAGGASAGAILRPHFKTHQSVEAGRWFRSAGITGITVSSVSMAHYFAGDGWDDITIAFPVNILEIDDINALAETISLGLLVLDPETVDFLSRSLTAPVKVWIKIDTGYGRTGLRHTGPEDIVSLAGRIAESPMLEFAGLLAHAGQSYNLRSTGCLRELYRETAERLSGLREAVLEAGREAVSGAGLISRCALSLGDTPTCSAVEQFYGVDEVRPGNFVFYDAQQLQIGSCREEDIAGAVAVPVVAKHPGRGEIILYGGAVHLSKQALTDDSGQPFYGYLVPWFGPPGDSGRPDSEKSPAADDTFPGKPYWGKIDPRGVVKSVSQEHGIASVPFEWFDRVKVGDIVAVIPVHSCLAMDLLRHDGAIIL